MTKLVGAARAASPAARALNDIAQALESAHVPERRLRRVLELLELLVPCERRALLLADPVGHLRFAVEPESGDGEQEGVHAVLERLLALLGDHVPVDTADLWPGTARPPLWRSHLAVPLIGLDRVLGVLAVGHDAPEAYDEDDLSLLAVAASQVGAYLAALQARERETAEALGRELLARTEAETAREQAAVHLALNAALRETAEGLRRSEERFRAVWENAADAMAISDPGGTVLMANPAYHRLHGYGPEEVIGKSFAVIFPPEARDRAREQHRRFFAADALPPPFEATIRRKDGAERFVESCVAFLTDEGGRTAMITVVRDVTDRRRAAEQMAVLQAVTAALLGARTPEEIVRVVFAGALDRLGAVAGGVHLVVGNGREVEVVAATGYPAESARSSARHPLEAPIPTAEAIRTGQPVWVRSAEELPARYPGAADPSPVAPVGAFAALPLAAQGRAVGALGIQFGAPRAFDDEERDFLVALAQQCGQALERARLDEAERAARAAAEAAVRSRDELLATITHDLKNPLASIQGYGQLLRCRAERGEPVPPDALAEAAGQVEASARRMTAMLDELLDLARLQAGDTLRLDRHPTDLVALARRVAAAHQRGSQRHRVLVETSLDALVGAWDAVQLERALDNLVGNAVKYSPDGGDVVVCVEGEGDEAVVSVADQGLGIPAADLPRVFERFHRGANVAGRIDGTGIGLASVRQIVEQHGGAVAAESREGSGSTFTVRLPRAGASDAAARGGDGR